MLNVHQINVKVAEEGGGADQSILILVIDICVLI